MMKTKKPSTASYEILFRCIDEPVMSWSLPGLRWIVEFWEFDAGYPYGQAWVQVPPPAPKGYETFEPYIDMLYVMEDYRRLGIGAALMSAIIERWPETLFDAINIESERFLRSIGLEDTDGPDEDGGSPAVVGGAA